MPVSTLGTTVENKENCCQIHFSFYRTFISNGSKRFLDHLLMLNSSLFFSVMSIEKLGHRPASVKNLPVVAVHLAASSDPGATLDRGSPNIMSLLILSHSLNLKSFTVAPIFFAAQCDLEHRILAPQSASLNFTDFSCWYVCPTPGN